MLEQPFLASALARLPLVDATNYGWCNTMATDGYFIYVDSNFCARLSRSEITFVFAHELMHCVLGHLDRRGAREAGLWGMAIDYATNLMLVEFGMQMPAEGLIEPRFCGMTAEGIFDELVEAGVKNENAAEKLYEIGGDAAAGNNDTSRALAAATPGGMDLHLDPTDTRGMDQRLKGFPSVEERRRLRVMLTKDVADKLGGSGAGYFQQEVHRAAHSPISWDALLSRFFTGLRRNDYRLFPPNRKHIWRGLILPALGVPGPQHIVTVVDTSGSMNDDELSKIFAALDRLRSATECKLTVIQCDAQIADVAEYESYETVTFDLVTVYGRGGTDFRPPFDWVAEHVHAGEMAPDALIYLTDGFGSFPDKAPGYPVLWVLTERSIPEVPFGAMVRMGPDPVMA